MPLTPERLAQIRAIVDDLLDALDAVLGDDSGRCEDVGTFVTPSWALAESLLMLARHKSIADELVPYTADEDIPRGRTIMVRMPKRFIAEE